MHILNQKCKVSKILLIKKDRLSCPFVTDYQFTSGVTISPFSFVIIADSVADEASFASDAVA